MTPAKHSVKPNGLTLLFFHKMESKAADFFFQINDFEVAFFIVSRRGFVELHAETLEIGSCAVGEVAADGDVSVFAEVGRCHDLELRAGKNRFGAYIGCEQEETAECFRGFLHFL